MTQWSQQGSLYRPASEKAMLKRIWFYSQFLGPCRKTLGSPVKRQHFVAATVAGLFCSRGPHAISRFVVAVVIFSFKGILWRRLVAHVLVKCFKRVSPSFAHPDSATTIPIVKLAFGIVASLDHVPPSTEFRSLSFSVGRTPNAGHLIAETSATLRMSTCEITATNNNLFATVASAEPTRVSAMVSKIFKNYPTTEYLSGQVFHSEWKSGRICFSHDDTSNIRLVRTAKQLQLLGRSHCTGAI